MWILDRFWGRIQDEPALTYALVNSVIALLIGFGLKWSPEQFGLVMAFTSTLLGWLTRRQVTPGNQS